MPVHAALPFSNWNYPTHILFGNGRVNDLLASCEQLNISKPLIVTDEYLVELPILKKIHNLIPHSKLFSHIQGNPTGSQVEQGIEFYKSGDFDGIVAVGGGSPIDAAKAIALMVAQERPLWDFEDIEDHWKRVNTNGVAPVIAIPTTAGTGAEVGRASVIVDELCQTKKIIFHPSMLPKLVILDPELTIGLPPSITAATGLDAFVHCFEAFCAPGYHPMADGIALQAMLLIKDNLPIVVKTGNDLNARGYMLTASLMGATAFQKGLGAIHALAHPLGAIYNKHHGLLNAILLPYVVEANKYAIEDKLKRITYYLNIVPSNVNIDQLFLRWVLEFRTMLSIPETLCEIGIDIDRAAEVAKLALADASSLSNPVEFTLQDYETIFINAVQGNLDEIRNI